MYKISKLTGKIYLNDIEIIQDDRLEEWQTMYQWQLNGGTFDEVDSTDEELLEEKSNKLINLQKVVLQKIQNYTRALSMGKSIKDDLDYFERVYTLKYEIAIGTKTDPLNTLELEANLEGYNSIQEYKELIINKFEQGRGFFEIAMQMNEVLRKQIFVDIELYNLDKAIQRLEIIDNLEDTIQVDDIQNIFNKVMSL